MSIYYATQEQLNEKYIIWSNSP